PPEIEGRGSGRRARGNVARRVLVIVVAAAALAGGLLMNPWPGTGVRREPAWSARLRPLLEAPLPAGAVVGLTVPAGTPAESISKVLYEAVWLRPDLRWEVASADAGPEAAFAVALGGGRPPAGWRLVWSGDGMTVWRP
ncbi:MAG: hypothetical protein LJE95_16285, partial [Acidobacteria bacterium]|nr:hypothetical protein [Acidobacteriota bacterium]